MCIGKTDAEAVQMSRLNHDAQFGQLRNTHLRQKVQEGERLDAFLQRSQRKFHDDEGMDDNLSVAQESAHFWVAGAQMINPNRSVSEDQSFPGRRRGTFFNPGMV